MIEATVSRQGDIHILTDDFKNSTDWEVNVYVKHNQKRIYFNTEEDTADFPLSDVIEFLQSLEENK